MSFPTSISCFLNRSLHHHLTSYILDNQYLKNQPEMKGNQNKDPNLVIISWVHNKN